MRTRIVLPIGVLLLTSLGAARADEPQRFAVVIGINDYADPAVPDLRYAESDARAVFNALTDPGVGRFTQDNVKLLLGAEASPSAIKSALYGLRGVSKDDLVVIFYSGHGAKEGAEAYWVTQNAQAKALPATALSNTDIRKFIDMIPSQRLVILLDCCYAASTVKKDLADPGKLFGGFAGKGRVTIAGAAENQEALEYTDKKAGVFTHFLVLGLRGGADANTDGVVTFDELWRFLGDNVRKASVRQGGLHEPKIITEEGVTPQFLLTFNPGIRAANEDAVALLRQIFDRQEISGALYDEGRKALSEPALSPEDAARREVFTDLVAGRLAPKYLRDVLDRHIRAVRATPETTAPGDGKSTLAVVPFDVLGDVQAKDAGAILAERLLPHFADRYSLIDQTQFKRFLAQDDMTAAELVEVAARPNTKSLSKAIKLRAVRYLVTGTVSGLPDGSLSVTARLCDWQTGGVEAGRIAQIGAPDWSELARRLPLLAARLGGSRTVGDDIDAPGIALPEGVDRLIARAAELAVLAEDLKQALKTLTPKHPRVVELTSRYEQRVEPLRKEIKAKVAELRSADTKLAEWYQSGHPERLAIAERLRSLQDLLNGTFWGVGATPPALTLDLGGGVPLDLVLIPAGEFLMGSPEGEEGRDDDEGPRHGVRIGRPFYMGKSEVTQAQWQAVMGSNPSVFKGDGSLPVEQVSWEDCQEFCRKLSAKTGRTVRLPTEAEWEYACRAGTTTPFHFGATLSTAQANYDGNYTYGNGRKGGYRGRTTPVGSFPPNAWGLYDMHGNVREWCHDGYAPYASGAQVDPQGPSGGAARVVRGGSWYDFPRLCRSSLRIRLEPGPRFVSIGFRVVVDSE